MLMLIMMKLINKTYIENFKKIDKTMDVKKKITV